MLDVGEPFFFKLKPRHGSKIAGFGSFVLDVNLPVSEAWTVFGASNGVRSEREMKEMRLDPPRNWSPNIVSGKSYDLTNGVGLRLWVPKNEQDQPRKEYLEMHSSEIFLG